MKASAISDSLWEQLQPLIPLQNRCPDKHYQRKQGGGRKPKPHRQMFDAIVYVLRHRCAWSKLPKALGSPSTVHRYFNEWEQQDLFHRLWSQGLAEHPDLQGVAWGWQWQVADTGDTSKPGRRYKRWHPIQASPKRRIRKAETQPARVPAAASVPAHPRNAMASRGIGPSAIFVMQDSARQSITGENLSKSMYRFITGYSDI